MQKKSLQNSGCADCPRLCGARRDAGEMGYCGVGDGFLVARCAPHMWEEPPISGTRGSGTVFFSGCNLRCVFCQNRTISREGVGRAVSDGELIHMILDLQEQGVHNINLVTPTHYTTRLSKVLAEIKPRLHVPVVWNSGGYESAESLRRLEGLVDVYLPDFKYLSPELSRAYSEAEDYGTVATAAITEMLRQTGPVTFDGEGMMSKGVLVRHLVLPGHRADSLAVLEHIAATLPAEDIRISVMSQYTPDYAADCPYKNLHRRVTSFEYNAVLSEVERLGLVGYCQGREAAVKEYTPDFE